MALTPVRLGRSCCAPLVFRDLGSLAWSEKPMPKWEAKKRPGFCLSVGRAVSVQLRLHTVHELLWLPQRFRPGIPVRRAPRCRESAPKYWPGLGGHQYGFCPLPVCVGSSPGPWTGYIRHLFAKTALERRNRCWQIGSF